MNIYVASSWRNSLQQTVVGALREAGHTAYDFHQINGFVWAETDPEWRSWSAERFLVSLRHPLAERSFRSDMDALATCDACVLVLPCGRSAHLEAGWIKGNGKRLVVLLDDPVSQPELMIRMADAILIGVRDVIAVLAQWDLGREPVVT